MTSTAEVHARIEAFAAALLDVTPAMMTDPTVLAGVGRAMALENTHRPALDLLTIAHILANGKATRNGYERGPEMALMTAAILDTVYGRARPPLRWCPHRTPRDEQLTVVTVALRHAGCPDCFKIEAALHQAALEHDTTCDVCDADNGQVTPRVFPLASQIITLFSGPCCDDLFTYATPAISTTYVGREPGRNEPCPCGSRRKYKTCCAARRAA